MISAARRLATLRMRVLTTFLRRVVILVRELDDERNDFPLRSDLALVVVEYAQAAEYLALRPDQDRALLEARFARGDRCFAVRAGDRLVHATWASTGSGPLPYLDADVRLAPHDVCFYDSYTAPGWRGHDVSRSRDELCRRSFRAAGMRRTVALIARENVGGLRTTVPLRYRAIGEYGLLRVGPLRRRWTTPYGAEPLPSLVPRPR